MKLLSEQNRKFEKAEKFGWLQVGLSLSPHTIANPKISTCSFSSPSCESSCLFHAGMGSTINAQKSRIAKTLRFLEDRIGFAKQVNLELQWYKLKAKSENKKLLCRLNVFSDIRWDKLKIENGKNIFELNKTTTFVDYTKHPTLISEYKNYHLIYSADKYNVSDEQLIQRLKDGGNVAMVFLNQIPKTWNGFPVVVGDESDSVWIGKKGVVSALLYKNAIRKGISNKDLIKNNTLIYESV